MQTHRFSFFLHGLMVLGLGCGLYISLLNEEDYEVFQKERYQKVFPTIMFFFFWMGIGSGCALTGLHAVNIWRDRNYRVDTPSLL